MKSMNDLEKVQEINLYPMKHDNKMQRKENICSGLSFFLFWAVYFLIARSWKCAENSV